MNTFAKILLCACACFYAGQGFAADVPAAEKSSGVMPTADEMTLPQAWEKIRSVLVEMDCGFEENEDAVKNYATALFERSRHWRVPAEERILTIAKLAEARAYYLDGESGDALDVYEEIQETAPATLFAAESLYREAVIYAERHQFDDALASLVALIETYPGSDRIEDAITQGYLLAKEVHSGARPRKFWGRIPWLQDKEAALRIYSDFYRLAPNAAIAPRILFQKGTLAVDVSQGWFLPGDRKEEAIDAFESLISAHADSPLVPDTYLVLAETYEGLCIGAEWDQISSRRALNYYTDFYTLFPENPRAEFAYEKTESLRNLLAANRVYVGDYFYSKHNNLRAAVVFYREAITYAPESPAGIDAAEKIEKIRRGERAPRTFVDWLFGRYPATGAVDFLDAPSQKPLEAMGFLSTGATEADVPAKPKPVSSNDSENAEIE